MACGSWLTVPNRSTLCFTSFLSLLLPHIYYLSWRVHHLFHSGIRYHDIWFSHYSLSVYACACFCLVRIPLFLHIATALYKLHFLPGYMPKRFIAFKYVSTSKFEFPGNDCDPRGLLYEINPSALTLQEAAGTNWVRYHAENVGYLPLMMIQATCS